jgi:hypothetical protein
MCDLEADNCVHIIRKTDESVRIKQRGLYISKNLTNNIFQVQILAQKGLINFQLKSAMNRIGLCASCHVRYEDQLDPRLTFYPQDIDFFIFFELRDRARRGKDGSVRRVPTAAQYAKRGALYTRIVFRRKGQDEAIVKDPARWDGAPLGALKRAFDIMGCPRADGIPEGDMQRLRDLWDLYHRDDDDTAQRVAARYGFSASEEHFGLGAVDSHNDQYAGESNDQGDLDMDWDSPSPSEQTELDQSGYSYRRFRKQLTVENPKCAFFDYRNWCWEFGPNSTSNQKAQQI